MKEIFDLKRKLSKKVPRLRKGYITTKNYVKYPSRLIADIKAYKRKPAARLKNIIYYPPNFIYRDDLNSKSIVVDVGCGYLADFSVHLINKYNLKSFAIDPTLKHQKYLEAIAKKSNGKFTYLKAAVSNNKGKITFYENPSFESGSINSDHKNILLKNAIKYEVDSIILKDLPVKIEVDKVDLLKLDIEGAEYDVLLNCTEKDLLSFNQLFIEFHHVSVKKYSFKDTQHVLDHLSSMGFNYFSLDDINVLFYR